ncbi:MAG: phosphatase PAP2 family protein [Treponema sp.]|nr:phosphatase PAP2 family protein [Candidatus Treponema merdequi]
MDIDYLLMLQNFRSLTESWLAPVMNWFTKFSVSFFPLAVIFIIYWTIDRNAGRRMLAGISLGYFLNGFLKLTFCVYRPWIRDARILPYGDSKIAATGYSFPSGHSTAATNYYANIAIWVRKKYKAAAVILFAMIFITMFSRNYLGVHTPQDVIVGFTLTFLMLLLAYSIENWSDKDADRRDKIILVSGIILCIASVLYYFFKPYPLNYNSEGNLIVDPSKMIHDSFEGIGYVFAFVICRYFERRGFDFENEVDWKTRFVIGICALVPMMWWDKHIVKIFTAFDLRFIGKFLETSGFIFYGMIVVPFIMKHISKNNLLEKIYEKLKKK